MKSKKAEPKKTAKKKKDVEPQLAAAPRFWPSVRTTVVTIKTHYKPILLATSIYGALYFFFVRVLTSVNITDLNESVVVLFGDGEESVYTQILTVGGLFGQSTNFDNQTGLMYALITAICSLALIWILRSIWGGKKPGVREAYYQGMYPLVPFVLVILFVFVQAIPFSIGSFLFQNSFSNGLAVTFIEKLLFVSIFATGILVSGYLIMGSIMAMYAATVPGVTPTDAFRSARKILKGRRFATLRTAILFMILTGVLIMAPMLLIVWLIPDAAVIAAALLIVLTLPWFHTFFYGLYRELLNG